MNPSDHPMFGSYRRIFERFEVAEQFRTWAMNPLHPENGSLFERDLDTIPPSPAFYLQNEVALFPTMTSALDPLLALSKLLFTRETWENATITGARLQTDLVSVMALSRLPIECAAKTVWLLGPDDADERAGRFLVLQAKDLSFRRKYLGYVAELHAGKPLGQFAKGDHRTTVEICKKVDAQVRERFGNQRTIGDSNIVTEAAQWIAAHPLAHPGALQLDENSAMAMYALNSGFVHGYSWVSDILRALPYEAPEAPIIRAVADNLAACLIFVECAVALYEAHRRAPGNLAPGTCPEYLIPSVERYSSDRQR
ncbi:hypothetical protein [Tsukamurella tyrosinosolvens]|uniref:hypothetical protein n=1 Tax=Tsukamurella tyrosinosolvens TaxID=57704 RepID=UPI002DD4400C|nr:hypothetical protein [Tsukamurella tyrosinosolvens]MEC4614612.1 hypothetical protein [Tsukamurella tyrosinosolvens]